MAALNDISGNLTIDYRIIDTGSRAALDALDIPQYDHVLVLGYSDHLAPQTADTRTLVTLLTTVLFLRDIAAGRPGLGFSLQINL